MNTSEVRKLVGKQVYAIHKQAGHVRGKVVKVSGQTVYIQANLKNGKKVHTNAILPLALFDLLAIGTSPFAFGGFGGFGFPGFGFGGFPGFFV